MISTAMLASYFENALNALIPDNGCKFKIWADVGDWKRSYRQGNKLSYYINGQLSVNSSAVTPNELIMGVNGLTLEFFVPVSIPKTSSAQTDSELQDIQNGQFYFVELISGVLLKYFTKVKTLSMQDADGNTFDIAMYSGVATPGVIDYQSPVGIAVPMSVSITLNFAQGGVNGMGIKVYLDGTLVPYLTLNPSRSSQLATDVQSNSVVQKHLSTSSAFGLQFTCISATENQATSDIYDYIADASEANIAHFVEIDWGAQRNDVYLMIFSTSNGTVTGAEFAGLNATLGEAYGNEEFLAFPQSFSVGKFVANSSSANSVYGTFNVSVTKTGAALPSTMPFYYYIGGKAYKVVLPKINSSPSLSTATYSATVSFNVDLSPADYAYEETTDSYTVYFITSAPVTMTILAAGFTYSQT